MLDDFILYRLIVKVECRGEGEGKLLLYGMGEKKRAKTAPGVTEKIPSFLFSINKIIILTSL